MERTQVHLPATIKEVLKQLSKEKDLPLSDLVRHAILIFLENEEKQKKRSP